MLVEDWKDRHNIECKILSHKIVASGPALQEETTALVFAAIAHLAVTLIHQRETEKGVTDSAFIRLLVDMKRSLIQMVNPGGAFWITWSGAVRVEVYERELYPAYSVRRPREQAKSGLRYQQQLAVKKGQGAHR
ncbi:hypothetical protein RvY_04657 [Ramazzottius varieornatus]|uniref:Uncharacterized protein n=1 Tax=Ramazzottius varieornatus TaxID=947166 RepID=A0A1D1UVN9_RAMVA|nr:hypothetical protein RvY_04657 [Ramazzottius varieornatus]